MSKKDNKKYWGFRMSKELRYRLKAVSVLDDETMSSIAHNALRDEVRRRYRKHKK